VAGRKEVLLSVLNFNKRIFSSTAILTLRALDTQEKKRIFHFTIFSSLLAVLDLIGVVVFGLIGTLAIRGIQNIAPSPRILGILKQFNLENQDFRLVLFFLTIVGSSFLFTKTLLSIYVTRKQIIFFNQIGARISNTILFDTFNRGLSKVKQIPPQDLRFVAQHGSRALANGVLASLVTLFADIVLLIAMIVILFIASPTIALSSALMFGSFAYILHKKQENSAFKLGSSVAESSRDLDRSLTEIIFGFRILFVRGDLKKRLDHLMEINSKFASLSAQASFLPSIGKYILEGFLIICVLSVIGIQFLVFDAARSVGVIAMFFVSAARVAPALLRVQQNVLSYRANSGTVKSTISYIGERKEGKSSLELSPIGNTFHSTEGSSFNPKVEVSNVVHKYHDAQMDTLAGVSLVVQSGTKVAIVGKSGSGKSTLVDLILGLMNPSYGYIKISGQSPSEIIKTFPGKISYLPQETFIFQGTLRDNISLKLDGSTEDDHFIWELLEMVRLSERFNGTLGLNVLLGDGQTILSGGEKQRVGLARALYSKPKLLVLDEATSSLDVNTENEVMRSILNMDKSLTVIAIAHRISSIANFDYIYMLEDGVIEDQGSFRDLYQRNSKFINQVDLLRLNK
jgi:ABC-type multidrug transport system fused ATPase/permease subunit